MNPGPTAIGSVGLSNFGVLVNPSVSAYRPTGITIDWTTVTALAAPYQYPGGTNVMTLPIGEKVIPAGSTLYRLGSGKYGVASDTTTLVKGECFVNDRTAIQSIHSEQFGEVFDAGTVFQVRLKVGGAGQPTLANFQAAFPRIGFYKD